MKIKKMGSKENWSKEWLILNDKDRDIIEDAQNIIPVSVGKIAKALGLDVSIATLEVGVSGEIFPKEAGGGFKIRINRHEPKARQRFTLAHEVAHFLLHKHLIMDGITDTVLYRSQLSNEVEAEANRLAADILMPREPLTKWIKGNGVKNRRDCLVPLSDLFQVSEDAMSIRLGIK